MPRTKQRFMVIAIARRQSAVQEAITAADSTRREGSAVSPLELNGETQP